MPFSFRLTVLVGLGPTVRTLGGMRINPLAPSETPEAFWLEPDGVGGMAGRKFWDPGVRPDEVSGPLSRSFTAGAEDAADWWT